MRIPPGVSESDYAEALRQFEGVVGKGNVYSEDADLDLYRDGYSILWNEPEEPVAAGAVAPKSVEDLGDISRRGRSHAGRQLLTIEFRHAGRRSATPIWKISSPTSPGSAEHTRAGQ